MIAVPAGMKVWMAGGGVTDMRRGMNTRAFRSGKGPGATRMLGRYLGFRGREGDPVKILWHDGVGMSLYRKRLEAGKFIWPVSRSGEAVQISAARHGSLPEGIDRRDPRWTH